MQDLRNTDCLCRVSANRSATDNVYHHLHEAAAPLAMGYVPSQMHWEETFDLCRALTLGTIFPSLHKPFCGKGGRCR